MMKLSQYHFTYFLALIVTLSSIANAQVEKLQFDIQKNNTEKLENNETQNPQDVSDKVQNTIKVKVNDLIHFGDLVDVDVLGSTEFDWRGRVTSEGFLEGIRFANDIYGLCQTNESVARQIEKSYSKFLNNPKVKVTILDRSDRPLSTVYGAVKLPRRYKLKRNVRLNELIVLSGGFTEKASGKIRLIRQPFASCYEKLRREKESAEQKEQNKEEFIKISQDNSSSYIEIDISDLLSGKQESNPLILYGDIISVLTAEPIYVIGGVANPTKIAMREELTVSRAISTAGGLTKDADPKNITIFRRENSNTNVYKINLEEINAEKEKDFVLKAYDIIDVAERGRDEKKYPPVLRDSDFVQNDTQNLPLRIID